MGIVFAVIFIAGATAFAVWSVIGLVGAIKERKARKANAHECAVDDTAHHEGHTDAHGERK